MAYEKSNEYDSHVERLTEDQRNELHQKIWELKQSGASPAEIRNIVQELLKEWGVIPENQ